jgi:hypothetical protein
LEKVKYGIFVWIGKSCKKDEKVEDMKLDKGLIVKKR